MSPKKIQYSLSIGIALIFLTQISFAQYPGMAQLRTSMNNQWMAQQMNMNMRMMSNFRYSSSLSSSRIAGAANEYSYIVKFKDGTTKTVKSYIYVDTLVHKSYLLLVDKSVPKSDTAHRKQKIYADNTLSIDRLIEIDSEDTTGATIVKYDHFTGMATDSCWRFNVLSGKINLYSIYSEKGGSDLFNPATVVGVQYNNGPITHLDADALKSFIASDQKAMKYFNKKEYYQAIEKFDKDTADK